MRPITKYLTGGFVLLALLIFGFISALRGCLSKYDERYAIAPVLYFKKDGKAVIFSIVKYNKTISYVQEGGITTKTFNNFCFIQSNDAVTGEKILSVEIKRPKPITNYNEEILGASGNTAWVFIDELSAFDAFSLQKVADVKMMEAKNPFLKNKFPIENRYYHFNNEDKTISFTAKDGSKWILNSTTLIASAQKTKSDSLLALEDVGLQAKLKALQQMNVGYTEMMVNQDTANAQWLGIYADEEIQKLNTYVTITAAYGRDMQRQLFTTTYDKKFETSFAINKAGFQRKGVNNFLLDGGFLLDKQTGKIITLQNPLSYLIVYKNQIGNDGKIILCRLQKDGSIIWTLDTNLSTWTDWNYIDKHIFITGTNNKALSSPRCNLLLNVNLDAGKANSYDFFTDKVSAFKE